MLRIESAGNPRVAAAARTLSRGERVALEGARMLGEALDAGIAPEIVFHRPGAAGEELLSRAEAGGAVLVEASEAVLERLSELPSGRGLVALAPLPRPAEPQLSNRGLAVLLDAVQDPANVGAIVRSAEAFGAEAVFTTAGSASPFTARALRVSAGSAFRLPIAPGLAPEAALRFCAEANAVLVGAHAHGGEPPEAVRALRPLVLVIGSEGRGISPGIDAALSRRVTIPLRGRVESLNAGAAAAVLLYALAGSG